MILALDCETTGVDLYHEARPFYVATCDDSGTVRSWRWDVDPETRGVRWDADDMAQVLDLVLSADVVVTQNGKFDVAALSRLEPEIDRRWPWEKTVDTMMAAHVLESNRLKNLTALGVRWLGLDVSDFEAALDDVVKRCRAEVRRRKLGWLIADEGLGGMPSAKDKLHKYDMWLPQALADLDGLPDDHEYRTAVAGYADADAELTVRLWPVMERELRRRKLWRIFQERNRAMRLAYKLERDGVTYLSDKLGAQEAHFKTQSEANGRLCVGIARGMGYDLELPKGGTNNSLRRFMFEGLEVEHLRNKKAKTDAPSLDKTAMDHYLATLPRKGRAWTFVNALTGKRAYDTALSYAASYRRFGVPDPDDPNVVRLHPHMNPATSDTLRWTCQNPNEQNISKKDRANLRKGFGPGPGREWWSLDARGIEDRLPAYISKQQELIDIFERPDDPPFYGSNHFLRFSIVYPDVWEQEAREVGLDKVGPHVKKKYAATYYQWCKNGGFAVQYGAMDRSDGRGTADLAFHRPGSHALLKERLSKLEALNQRCIRFAEKHGYIETLPDRSVDPSRGYPLLVTRTDYGRILPTVPLNYHIQGTAMWWTHRGMVRTDELLKTWQAEDGFDGFVTMQVHDEIVLDLPAAADPRTDPAASNLARVREVAAQLRKCGDDMGVPTPVSIEYHPDNWADGVSFAA